MLTNRVKRLYKMAVKMNPKPAPAFIHLTLKHNWQMWPKIREYEHEGKVYLVESGTDCDGTQYSGHIHDCAAHPWALRALEDSIGEWADGPFHLNFIKYEEITEVHYTSRDLALEAFENGHLHYLTSAY